MKSRPIGNSIKLPSSDLEFIGEQLADCWADLKNERVFLTGATGFFGVWLLESFAFANANLGLNAKATILSRDPSTFRIRFPYLASNPCFDVVRGDVKSFLFPDGTFRYVIHAAASTSGDQSAESEIQVYADNIQGAQRVLEFAARASAERVLFTSSGAVYGAQPTTLAGFDESQTCTIEPMMKGSSYSLSKLVAEQLSILHSQAQSFDVMIARCFAFVGPNLPLNGRYAIGNFILDAINRRDIQITGDGTAVRSYLYAADLAVWLWRMLFRGVNRRIYNVGSTAAYSMMELANLVRETVCPELSIVLADGPSIASKAGTRYVPDTSRARLELLLNEWCSTQDAISRTYRWYREHLNQK